MRTAILSKLTLAALLVSLGCRPLRAQPNAAADSSAPATPLDAEVAAQAPDIIFSNLSRNPDDRFNNDPYFAFPIIGQAVRAQTESWYAVAFTPKEDTQATVLSAAIGYVSGTKLVTLGIHSDSDGTVGALLPGAQGSTTNIPDSDACCQLARVTLPGEGVTLTAGTRYWLVAGPDNVNGPTFYGKWRLSYVSSSGGLAPPLPWQIAPGGWPAAQVRGTNVRLSDAHFSRYLPKTPLGKGAAPESATIFSNIDRFSAIRYDYYNGAPVTGNEAPFEPEVWEALPFTPKHDVHAKRLSAAIGYYAGTKKVNLGIYSDSGGTVGSPLPGAQGGTSVIPDDGDCCQLISIILPGTGVALTGGTQYWLVASPDNVNAPDFEGFWHYSNDAVRAYEQPERGINWTSIDAGWLATKVEGTQP